jgi:AcrR family transcriptional regulator
VEADRLITEPSLRAVDGRVPGRRGQATRQRLLDSTRQVLETTAYRDLKVVDIARSAGTSPATFYQYFPDIEAALLSLARDLADEGGATLRGLVEGADWSPSAAFAAAQAVAEGYLALWEHHRALIGVIDLAALEGDGRFRELRTALLRGANAALQQTIAVAVEAGRLPADTDIRARSGVLVSMLAHVAAHSRGMSGHGMGQAHLRDEMARIIAWSVAGVG